MAAIMMFVEAVHGACVNILYIKHGVTEVTLKGDPQHI